jgi:hypothetical protein
MYIEGRGESVGRAFGVKVEIKTYKRVPHPQLGMDGYWP